MLRVPAVLLPPRAQGISLQFRECDAHAAVDNWKAILMVLGPIETLVIGFKSGNFTREIVGEVENLVNAKIIIIVDGIFVTKVSENKTAVLGFDQLDAATDAAKVAALLDGVKGLIGEDDVDTLTEALPVGTSAAILVFEHTWLKPLRTAIVNAGGELVGTAARASVLAGTVTAVSGALQRRTADGSPAALTEAQNEAAQNQVLRESQTHIGSLQAQLAAQQQITGTPTSAAAGGGDHLMSQLKQLAELKAAGMLDDSEFTAAKAKLLTA